MPEQVPAQRGEVIGQEGALGPSGLAAAGQRVAPQGLGLGPAVEGFVGVGQEPLGREGIGVVRADRRPEALEGLPEERDRPVELAVVTVRIRQVATADERVGVVAAELRLSDLERDLVQRDGLGGAAGGPVGGGEAVAA